MSCAPRSPKHQRDDGLGQGLDLPSAKPHENVIAFSRAMFDHAHGYRNVYFALLNTGAWPIVRRQLQAVLEDLMIRRECKAEIAKLKTANSEVPVDLFVHYLPAAFFAVLICGWTAAAA